MRIALAPTAKLYAEWHGKVGTVERNRRDDGRIVLKMENGKQVAMKPGNLVLVEPVSAAESSSPCSSGQSQRGLAMHAQRQSWDAARHPPSTLETPLGLMPHAIYAVVMLATWRQD